jgi:hypothetical protein
VAQQAYPFDAGAGAAVNEGQWQAMARRFLATGVITGSLNQLAVTADGSGMSVTAASGDAFVIGFFYRNDAALALTIAAANATNPRVDTVVVRLDRAANTTALAVITGTAATSPVPPTLTQSDDLFELPLADVTVPAAAGVIVAANVTDRRVLSRNLSERDASAAYETLIAQVVLGAAAANITFTAIPQTYRHLLLVLSGRSDAAVAATPVHIRLNGDTGANYDTQRMNAAGTALAAVEFLAATAGFVGAVPGASATAGMAGITRILLPDYRGTARLKTWTAEGGESQGTGTGQTFLRHDRGQWRSAVAITDVGVYPASGNFAAATVATLYGLKGA